MFKVTLIAKDKEEGKKIASALEAEGYALSSFQEIGSARKAMEEDPPELVLLDLAGHTVSSPDLRQLAAWGKDKGIPILLMLTKEELAGYDYALGLEDFALKPSTSEEIIARIKQIRWQKSKVDTKEVIKRGDLIIDLARYEVYLSGKAISLTFKEFELLQFLASNPDRVFSRETLLSRVWGYDYYGGTRTVDVHIRRLRSKIEDATHTFIETIRNVGYRFKETE